MPQPLNKRLVTEQSLTDGPAAAIVEATLDSHARLSEEALSASIAQATEGKVDAATAVATYAKIGAPLGAIHAILGDSLANFGEGVLYYASVLSEQQINVRGTSYVASYPGETSATIKTHVAEIVALDPRPDVCWISAGSNDAGATRSLAAYQADMVEMFDGLRAAGIVPGILTVPPRASRREMVRVYNTWLRDYARRNRLPVADWQAAVVDPATGNWLAAYDNGDNVHPNAAGVELMAQTIIAACQGLVPPAQVLTAQSSGGSNLQPNSSFTVDSNADGLAEFLTATPSTGFAYSRVADAAGFFWQRITLSGASSAKKILGRALASSGVSSTLAASSAAGATSLSVNHSLPNGTYLLKSATSGEVDVVVVTGSSGTGPYTVTLAATLAPAATHAPGDTIVPCFEVGDRLLIAARVRSGQSGTTAKHALQATFYTAAQASVVQNRLLTSPASGMSRQIPDGVVYAELVVPATAAVLQLDFTAGPGDGTYDIAHPTIYNLTKMGL